MSALGTKNITAFTPLVFDWSLAMTREPTRLACEYWRSRCGSSWAPQRTDIAPAAMRKFIAHVGLVTIESAGGRNLYTIRHAGTEWENVFGPMSGKRLDEFLPAAIENRWRDVFDSVCGAMAPLRVTTRIEFRGKTWLRTELFVAPLRGADDSLPMLFICFTTWSERGN